MMPLTGTRHTDIRVELFDKDESPMGPLLGVQPGGQFAHTNAASVRSSGNLIAHDRGQDIDWLSVRLQPIITVNQVDYPLGMFLPSAPVEVWSATGMIRDIQVLDKLTILDQDIIPGWYSLPAGTNVLDTVKTLIEDTGEAAGALTMSDETLRGNYVTERPNCSRLQIINELLRAAGYFALWCDVYGQYRAEPSTLPSERPVVYDFSDGPKAIRSAQFTRDEDVWKIPNEVSVVSRSSGDEPALIAVARNEDPGSRTSIPARGRVVTHAEEDVEITSQEALDVYAQRRLVELSSAIETIQIPHAFIPLELNAAVRFKDTTSGYSGLYVIQRMEIPFSRTELMTTTLRGVQA